ncbi:hypothetical protein PTE30175_04873 [Pandoraea terrae]|uniref:Uncharacterized protein n=1 Tax=Pandoraea terrae TaxID=1537710 RepID=A0A5E4Z1M3_9BURK|nr:hypothetical protein PTE30175_04873 [Pandoraea terrae]
MVPRTDEAVACKQLIAKPGHAGGQRAPVLVDFAVNGVEPDGNFRQLDRNGIQVHAKHIAVSQIHAHLLQLLRVVVVRYAKPQLRLFALQVGFGELIDGLVQECSAAHGRLANGERKYVVGILNTAAAQQLFERIFDQAFGQHLRGVVASGFLPVTPRQTVDEATPLMLAQHAVPRVVGVENSLILLVVVQAISRNKPGIVEQICAVDFSTAWPAEVDSFVAVVARFHILIAFVIAGGDTSFLGGGLDFV